MSGVARLSFVLSVLSLGVAVHLCARVWTPRRLFFVALDREIGSAERERSRRLLALNAALTLCGVGVALSAPAASALALVLPLIALALLLAETLRLRRAGLDARIPVRFSVPLAEPAGPLAYTSAALWLGNGALVALGFVLFASMVNRMPARIPLKWGISGEVVRRGSPSELWFLGGIMLLQLLLVLFAAWCASRERWALPEHDQERYVALQRERRSGIVRMIEILALVSNVGVGLLWLGCTYAAFADRPAIQALALGLGTVVLGVGPLLLVAVFLGPLTRVQDEIRQIAGSDVLGTHPAGWRWSGLVYYAPEDPAVFVPKRMGIGQTLNFARPAAWAVLGAPVLVAVVLVLLT